MKRFFITLTITLFLINSNVYAQSVCETGNRVSGAVGNLEKYVYRSYANQKGEEKQLHIGLARPVDNKPASQKRPLIIGVHGGGFVDFCPFMPCYVKYSENILTPNFTGRGFLTAAVQYRLTPPFDFKPPKINDQTLKETQYKATQDVRAAIKYIFENAGKLGVDTDNVFLMGTSAGAITALAAAYLDDEEVPGDLLKKYGGLAKREKIRGVISLSGAISDLSYLDGADKVPLFVVHGNEDRIVPFEKGFYLGMKHLTPVYGGHAAYEAARKKGIDAGGYFNDFGHAYPSRFLKDIYGSINEFISLHLSCAKNGAGKIIGK